MELNEYKRLFNKFEKEEYFEMNKPFIENMISTQNQIDKFANLELVITHPSNPNLQKQTESGKMYIKLLEVFKNQTLALNKILGNTSTNNGEDDPFKKIREEFE